LRFAKAGNQMYETFFGLAERPFTLRPDPSFLYLGRQHALALSMLEFGLTGQAGFVVVTGEVGAGKTTLIRHFTRRDNPKATIGVISNTRAGFGDVLEWACEALNIKAETNKRSRRYQAFASYLAEQYRVGQQVLLIVDEAQNLNIPALEDLRLLSNIDQDRTLQIILVGQPELMEKLKRPELRQFAQRISVHYHLSPLTYRESCAYIQHRLSVAGAEHEIFDSWAMAAIYYFADGVPRVMNSICDMSMIYAYSSGEHIVDIETVFSVVQGREKNGVLALSRQTCEISRDDLIDKAIRCFDEIEHSSFADQAAANGHFDVIPSVSAPVNGRPLLQAEPPREPDSISATRSNAEDIAELTEYEPERRPAVPPITAVYLSDNVIYPRGARGQPKPGAFQWLRRHLSTHRDH
jgi:general secretion pathway protein A